MLAHLQPAELAPDPESSHPSRQLTAAAGLYGVDATDATTLLTHWKERPDGAEAIWSLASQANEMSSVNLETLLEDDDAPGSDRFGSSKSAGEGKRKLKIQKG